MRSISTSLYTWVKRCTAGVKCLAQGYKAKFSASHRQTWRRLIFICQEAFPLGLQGTATAPLRFLGFLILSGQTGEIL